MLGQRFVEAAQVIGDGGGKTEQREVAKEHSGIRVSAAGGRGFAVIPAEAGIQGLDGSQRRWIPAFAGMTVMDVSG